MRALVSTSAYVGEPEVRDEFERRNAKVKFEYGVLNPGGHPEGNSSGRPGAQGLLRAQQGEPSYAIPEKRQIKYAVVRFREAGGRDPGHRPGLAGLL